MWTLGERRRISWRFIVPASATSSGEITSRAAVFVSGVCWSAASASSADPVTMTSGISLTGIASGTT
jgi:hypothetical protein